MAEEVLSNGGDPCGRPYSLFVVNLFIDGELQCDLSRHNENPFKSLEILLQRPAYMAMFLKHLHETKGCEATVPLLFLLRVGAYYHLAKGLLDGKDSKRQAQSIIHTFLSQNAPWTMVVDPAKLEDIDTVFRSKEVSVEEAYTLFNPIALDVGEAISAQLESYQQTLKAEDDDDTLQEDLDRSPEYQVMQKLLSMVIPQSAYTAQDGAYAMLLTSMALALGLDPKSDFLEKLSNLQQKGMLGASPSTMLNKGKGKHQLHIIAGHNFVATHYNSPTFCDFCNGLLWGIGNQGYTCQLCTYNVHKATCNQSITEYCRGEPKDGAASIFRRGSLKPSFSGSFRQGMRPSASRCSVEGDSMEAESLKRRLAPLYSASSNTMLADSASIDSGATIDRSSSLADRATGSAAPASSSFSMLRRGVSNATQCSAGAADPVAARVAPKILRAQSMKVSNATDKGGRTPTGHHGQGRDTPQGRDTRRSIDNSLMDSTVPTSREYGAAPASAFAADPDMHVDEDLVPWSMRTSDSLPDMDKSEIKRQDLIHELVHTEQTHVKKLKVLLHVFYTPLLASELFAAKLIDALFPGLEALIGFHVELMNGLKTCLDASNHGRANEIGTELVQFFSGDRGDQLRDTASEWVKLRQANVDFLKLYSTKQPKLGLLITQCESDPICTRLKLTDLSSVVMQRFTKYPLLLACILKVTDATTPEHGLLHKAIDLARGILAQINQDVMEFENNCTLFELQSRIDFKSMDKLTGTLSSYRTLDISSRELIHRGDLKWKQKGKLVSVDALLFPDILVLLEHNEDKVRHCLRVRDDYIPIITLKDLLPPREVASDKERRSFLLVWLTSSGSRMYELSANTSDLSCTWRVKISDAIAASKSGTVNVTSLSYSRNIKAYVLRAHVNYARSLSTQETVDSIDVRRHSDQPDREKEREKEREEREIEEARVSPKSSCETVPEDAGGISPSSAVTTTVSRPTDSGAEMSEAATASSETERGGSLSSLGATSPKVPAGLSSPVGTASSDLVVQLENCLSQTRHLANLAKDAIKETQARGRSIRTRPNSHNTDSSTSRMFSAIESIRGQLRVSLELAKRTVVEQRHTSVAIAAAAAAAAAAPATAPRPAVTAVTAVAVVSDAGRKEKMRSPSPRNRRNITTLQVQEEEPPSTIADEETPSSSHKITSSYSTALKKTLSCLQKDALHSQIKRSWSDTPAYSSARAVALAKHQGAVASMPASVTVPHLSVDSSNLAAQRQLQLDVV